MKARFCVIPHYTPSPLFSVFNDCAQGNINDQQERIDWYSRAQRSGSEVFEPSKSDDLQ